MDALSENATKRAICLKNRWLLGGEHEYRSYTVTQRENFKTWKDSDTVLENTAKTPTSPSSPKSLTCSAVSHLVSVQNHWRVPCMVKSGQTITAVASGDPTTGSSPSWLKRKSAIHWPRISCRQAPLQRCPDRTRATLHPPSPSMASPRRRSCAYAPGSPVNLNRRIVRDPPHPHRARPVRIEMIKTKVHLSPLAVIDIAIVRSMWRTYAVILGRGHSSLICWTCSDKYSTTFTHS